MTVVLNWTNRVAADVIYIYRDTAPFDEASLPPVYATLAADAEQFVDSNVFIDTDYFYRVGHALISPAAMALSGMVSTKTTTGAPSYPTDPYIANVIALKNDWTSLSPADYPTGQTMSVAAGTPVSDASNTFNGIPTLGMDGASELQFDSSTGWNIDGTQDFTFEWWLYPAAVASYGIVHKKANFGWAGFQIATNSSGIIDFWYTSGSSNIHLSNSTPFSAGVFQHFALVRSNSQFAMFLDGVQDMAWTAQSPPNTSTLPFVLGKQRTGSAWTGNIGPVRFTFGTARYLADFTPENSFPLVAA